MLVFRTGIRNYGLLIPRQHNRNKAVMIAAGTRATAGAWRVSGSMDPLAHPRLDEQASALTHTLNDPETGRKPW